MKRGSHHTPETKKKIGEANQGRSPTPETREKMRQAQLGRHHTAQTLEKMRQANLGKRRSPETREKIRQAKLGKPSPRRGKHHSLESRAKMSVSALERMKNPVERYKSGHTKRRKHPSEETLKKLREIRTKQWENPEFRKRMQNRVPWNRGKKGVQVSWRKGKRGFTAWNKGMHPSEETRKKMSDFAKHRSPITKERMKVSIKRRWEIPSEHTRLSESVKKKMWEPETRQKYLRALSDPERLKNLSKSLHSKTKPEKHLERLLQSLYPNEFKYNGRYDCGVSIDRLLPDFVNIKGKKQVIDVHGTYWHKDENAKDRQERYAKHGYSSLIIWQNELKSEKEVIRRIVEFVGREPRHYFETN